MSSPLTPPPDQPDCPGEQYQPLQPPNSSRRKILPTRWRVTLAIAGPVAVLIVIRLVAPGATGTIDTYSPLPGLFYAMFCGGNDPDGAHAGFTSE